MSDGGRFAPPGNMPAPNGAASNGAASSGGVEPGPTGEGASADSGAVSVHAGGLTAEEAVERKMRAAAGLSRVRLEDLPAVRTDGRIGAYLAAIRDEPEAHNLYEVLAALRFCEMHERHTWRGGMVTRFFRLYESLKFSGIQGRRSYQLTPVQAFQFASILGFYDRASDGVWERTVREAYLFVPRKFSKTTSTASLAVHELLYGDDNAQAYTGANSYKQAQVCFKEIKKLVQQLDPGRKRFKCTREHVEWRDGNPYGKESFAECLTGGGDTKDGLAASLVIMDEYAQARYVKDHSVGAELLNVLRSSMGIRRNPLTMIITTASRVPDGPFALELEGAKRMLLGEYEDDTLFASLFQPDPGDLEDLGRPELWKKCNPHIGVTVRESFYADSWRAAQRNPEQMAEFKTKLLNIFVTSGTKEWIPRGLLEKLTGPAFIDAVSGRPDTMVAIDLSVSDDFSAVTYSVYGKRLRKFYLHTDYYIPAETLAEHPNKLLYQYWVSRGWMKVCPGRVIDGRMIVEDILARNQKLRILQIGYDSYKSVEVVNMLAGAIGSRAGQILKPVPQTYGAFTSPVETFEMAAKREPPGIQLDDNPIQVYCLSNAYIDKDRLGNKKPVKRKANLKIDSAVTSCMTFWLWNNYEF